MSPQKDTKTDHNKEIEKLSQQNLELQTQVDELTNSWKRALADYQNLQNRVVEEREQTVRYANQVLISKLIFILDNLKLLQVHLDDQGMNMIVKELENTLKEEGLEQIQTDGEVFDETTMEAIELVPGDKHVVVETVQPGYLLRNKVIRPARVNVGNGEKVEEAKK